MPHSSKTIEKLFDLPPSMHYHQTPLLYRSKEILFLNNRRWGKSLINDVRPKHTLFNITTLCTIYRTSISRLYYLLSVFNIWDIIYVLGSRSWLSMIKTKIDIISPRGQSSGTDMVITFVTDIYRS